MGAAGDMDGDGYADVIVGAWNEFTGFTNRGNAYVYFGPSLPTDDWFSLEFAASGLPEALGGSVGTAGDVNGDGHDDVLVGANDAGGADSNAISVSAPGAPSTQVWVKITPADLWTSGSDRSDAFFTIRDPAGVGPDGPNGLRLAAPRPNPASSLVRLELALPTESVVAVSVFDLAGREVARPVAAGRFAAGTVSREWRPQGLAPGVHTVRTTVGDVRLTQRLVWLGGR